MIKKEEIMRKPNAPDLENDLLTIYEIAHFSLKFNYVKIAEHLDISDDELSRIEKFLEKELTYLNG